MSINDAVGSPQPRTDEWVKPLNRISSPGAKSIIAEAGAAGPDFFKITEIVIMSFRL
jgi:hypothetical protein